MPRPLRIQYEGAIYHPVNRGDRREVIFSFDEVWLLASRDRTLCRLFLFHYQSGKIVVTGAGRLRFGRGQ